MKMIVRSLVLALGVAAVLFSAVELSAVSSAQTADVTPTPTPPTAPVTSPTPFPEDEVIKIDTELVNLNVRVVDRNNRPINNVPENDFSIFEDGVQQQIEFFSRAEVPVSYSLVIDNSGSIKQQLEKVIDAGKILAGSNNPDDQTSVIRFISSEKIEIVQDFTSNLEDINYALDNMYFEGGRTAIIDAVYLAASSLNDHSSKAPKSDRRRTALILVSDGEESDSYYSQKQLFDLLRELDVQIFTIGFIDELRSERGFISKSAQGKAKGLLEKLAKETGGNAYFPASLDDLDGIAREIGAELRMQYSIGYIPTNDREDGTFRNIRVVVKDGPNKQKRIAVTKTGRVATKQQ